MGWLTEKQRHTLRAILVNQAPDLEWVANAPSPLEIDGFSVARVFNILTTEFTRSGLQKDLEPNERGKCIDEIIGKLVGPRFSEGGDLYLDAWRDDPAHRKDDPLP